MRNSMGGFACKLWDAIAHADENNLHRLSLGFPEQVQSFEEFAHGTGDLVERFSKVGVHF